MQCACMPSADMLRELVRQGRKRGIAPDPGIDAFMKVCPCKFRGLCDAKTQNVRLESQVQSNSTSSPVLMTLRTRLPAAEQVLKVKGKHKLGTDWAMAPEALGWHATCCARRSSSALRGS